MSKSASRVFTDGLIAAITSGAAGDGSRATATAALEAAAGTVARGLASASVKGAPEAILGALSPSVLALIGRDLIRRGESVFQIEIQGEALRLFPVGSWDVRGPWDEAEWFYRIDLFGPSGNVTKFVPSAGVLHCRYAINPSRPWHGIGPLGWAALSGSLHAGVVGALSADMNAAYRSTVIPMPPGGTTVDEADDPLADLKSAIVSAQRANLFWSKQRAVPSAATIGTRRQAIGQQRRLGPMPDPVLGRATRFERRGRLGRGVASIRCLPAYPKGDGTLSREVFRRFERLTLKPLALIVEAELRSKLDAPYLELSFNSLRASDFAGVSQGFQRFDRGRADAPGRRRTARHGPLTFKRTSALTRCFCGFFFCAK